MKINGKNGWGGGVSYFGSWICLYSVLAVCVSTRVFTYVYSCELTIYIYIYIYISAHEICVGEFKHNLMCVVGVDVYAYACVHGD